MSQTRTSKSTKLVGAKGQCYTPPSWLPHSNQVTYSGLLQSQGRRVEMLELRFIVKRFVRNDPWPGDPCCHLRGLLVWGCVLMAGLTCAHRLLNVHQVGSLTHTQSPTRLGHERLLKPAVNHTHTLPPCVQLVARSLILSLTCHQHPPLHRQRSTHTHTPHCQLGLLHYGKNLITIILVNIESQLFKLFD